MRRLLLMGLLAMGCGGGGETPEPTTPRSTTETPSTSETRPHHGHRPGHAHSFADVERFAQIFDDPARDAWQRPEEVVSLLALEPGMRVADVGAGTGYFLPHLSAAVGDEGAVLALDTEPAMVEHMRGRIGEASMANVEASVVAPDDPGLTPASVDRILIVDTWHHIADRAAYAARLASALRPGGFVLVIDFTRDAPDGPPAAMRLPPETVVAELGAALDATVLEETLPRQYAVRAARR